jgi:hypothetical protein
MAKSLSNLRETSKLVLAEKPHIADVIIISEGLGNSADMNYYGPEALASAPSVFEGAGCFFNHSGTIEENDLPERRVQDKIGFYKNVRVVGKEVHAELHFDISESGKLAYDKCRTALEYRKQVGDGGEFIGISVSAGGESEERTMLIDGVETDVNYITKFVPANGTSADLVTMPARGGKILALKESQKGRGKPKTEETMKELITKITESLSAALKHKSVEAGKPEFEKVTALLTEAAEKCEAEGELPRVTDAHAKLQAEHEALLKKHEDIAAKIKTLHDELHGKAADDSAGGGESVEPEKKVNADGESEGEAAESKTVLIGYKLKEAGIPAEIIDLDTLCKKPLKAIEAAISREKKLVELRTGGKPLNESTNGSGEILDTANCTRGIFD